MGKQTFFAMGSEPRSWGQASGSVRDLFKLLTPDGDYLVRFGDASIEQRASVFTPYPGKRRLHVVLDQGACEYQGAYSCQQHLDFDVFDFDASQPIHCVCHRPAQQQRVLNVIHAPRVQVELVKTVFAASGHYALPSVAPHQVDFFYFVFDPCQLLVQARLGSQQHELKPYSVLLVDKQDAALGEPLQLSLQPLLEQPSGLDLYHFRLIFEHEENYVAQTYSPLQY